MSIGEEYLAEDAWMPEESEAQHKPGIDCPYFPCPKCGCAEVGELAEMHDEIIRLRQVKADLLGALEFYADPGNYGLDDWGVDSVIQPPEYGKPGTIARAAIAKAGKES